ncbi:MAG: phage tail protein [Chloroflexi bacterium]|nr:MAG: phage tail protein [Chloroflexota bacterium]
MSEPFIAEIRIFAGNFAPRGWAFCNGQLLPIAQNTALFSLIGTTYGGDGRTTTALPNLQGRAPMHPGRGPGLTSRRLGERGGVESVTLSEAQMPSHTHSLMATSEDGNRGDPAGNTIARGTPMFLPPPQSTGSLANQTLPSAGGSQAHNNVQPFLTMNFIIALVGLYPSRG